VCVCGDLFGGSPGSAVVEGLAKIGEMGVDRLDHRGDPAGIDAALGQREGEPVAQDVGEG
jgi:hypothetical protein